MTDPDNLAARFEDHRTRLRAVAYRMLGSMSEADDAVQDAWLRVSRADTGGIDNFAGWLTTIVARLCLDRLRTRASRREEPIDASVPDPIVSAPGGVDPEQEAILADSVGLAMLVVLERLTPAERLAFVLHDTFGLRFDEIAPIVGRTEIATRQLASRARRRVQGAAPDSGIPRARQWELVEAFLAAAREGDFEALLRVLDPDIVARADTGPGPSPLGPSRVIRGSETVAKQALAFRNLAPGARRALVNGEAGFVVYSNGSPYAVIAFAFGEGTITEIDILADPERLATLDLSAARKRVARQAPRPPGRLDANERGDTVAEATIARSPLLDALRGAIRGRVTGPDDPAYDAERTVMYGGFDKHPAAIARVTDAPDIGAVIAVARELGLPVSVRSGGHGVTAQSVVDDGIVIDVRDLTSIEFDVPGRTAWAGTGLTAVEFSRAVGEHRLAVGFGDTGSVGLGGITLGGGVGYLVRKVGLTIDSLLAAEIVTADGEVHLIDADREPDVFWAIRGGGGNFGVATRFRFRLSEVPAFTGGLLILPASGETVARFIAESEAAPEALTTIANVMPCPPLPFVPEEHHGKLVIFGLMAYAGDDEAAARDLAPFRSLATPIADMVKPIPYPEIYPPEDDSYHPLAVARNLFVDRFDRATADRIMATLEASDASLRVAQIRVLGGAAAGVPNDATAYAHRDRPIMVNVAAFYEGAEDKPRRQAWVDEFAGWLSGGDQAAYVNFIGAEGAARTRAAYPGPTWDRLRTIKARYDPTNLFDGNQNIPPAALP